VGQTLRHVLLPVVACFGVLAWAPPRTEAGNDTPRDTFTCLAKATKRPGRRLLLLVDISGSMSCKGRNPFNRAMRVFKMLTQRPIDEALFAVLAFNTHPYRWAWTPAKGKKPRRWVELPNAHATKAAAKWLNYRSNFPGSTNLAPSLWLALSEPVKDLTICIVTDGQLGIGKGSPKFWATLKKLQAKRVRLKLDRAIIGTVAVDGVASVSTGSALRRLGREGGAGVWHVGERTK